MNDTSVTMTGKALARIDGRIRRLQRVAKAARAMLERYDEAGGLRATEPQAAELWASLAAAEEAGDVTA